MRRCRGAGVEASRVRLIKPPTRRAVGQHGQDRRAGRTGIEPADCGSECGSDIDPHLVPLQVVGAEAPAAIAPPAGSRGTGSIGTNHSPRTVSLDGCSRRRRRRSRDATTIAAAQRNTSSTWIPWSHEDGGRVRVAVPAAAAGTAKLIAQPKAGWGVTDVPAACNRHPLWRVALTYTTEPPGTWPEPGGAPALEDRRRPAQIGLLEGAHPSLAAATTGTAAGGRMARAGAHAEFW